MFNALKYTEELEKAGFSQEQAKASLKLIIEVMNEEFATKSDLKELEWRLDAKFHSIDLRFQSMESKFEQLEYRLTMKLGGMIALSTGIMATLIRFVPNH